MSAPSRPPEWQVSLGRLFLSTFSPRLPKIRPLHTPGALAPFERLAIPRAGRGGSLAATWYPAAGEARGAVLLAHPWLEWGQAYFHRYGRLEALREAGYHALTFDLSGIGGSDPPMDFGGRDLEDAFRELRERAPGLPLHLWAVSAGGYWSHFFLARTDGFSGAMFEDVSPHLVEWSQRMRPSGWPVYATYRNLVPRAYRYFDIREHAPYLRVRAAAYVGGDQDPGIPQEDIRELARLAGAECRIVAGAGHLAAIKMAGPEVVRLALETFGRAERADPGAAQG
ncbi:MAG TPA: alpha/beta fold hydrolase [Thermoanaerobaculia bacterium]|nr:alpha/beta fold hydrolase [Thermoanaerobaculia bacterium]